MHDQECPANYLREKKIRILWFLFTVQLSRRYGIEISSEVAFLYLLRFHEIIHLLNSMYHQCTKEIL